MGARYIRRRHEARTGPRNSPQPAASACHPTGPKSNAHVTKGKLIEGLEDRQLLAQILSECPVSLVAGANPLEITTGPDNSLWSAESGTGKIGHVSTAGSLSGTSRCRALAHRQASRQDQGTRKNGAVISGSFVSSTLDPASDTGISGADFITTGHTPDLHGQVCRG
jgi:hypothetical protein